jgi:hypothetical protein
MCETIVDLAWVLDLCFCVRDMGEDFYNHNLNFVATGSQPHDEYYRIGMAIRVRVLGHP